MKIVCACGHEAEHHSVNQFTGKCRAGFGTTECTCSLSQHKVYESRITALEAEISTLKQIKEALERSLSEAQNG